MSDLISREETQKALYGCVMPNQHAEDILAKVPSADIMECARAIKEYCKQHRNENKITFICVILVSMHPQKERRMHIHTEKATSVRSMFQHIGNCLKGVKPNDNT